MSSRVSQRTSLDQSHIWVESLPKTWEDIQEGCEVVEARHHSEAVQIRRKQPGHS